MSQVPAQTEVGPYLLGQLTLQGWEQEEAAWWHVERTQAVPVLVGGNLLTHKRKFENLPEKADQECTT